MSDVDELVEEIFADAWDPDHDGFDATLWATCEQTGLARLTLPEEAGGSGGTLLDAASALTAAGRHAARVPLAETDLCAAWLLHAAGLDVPEGPLAAVVTPEAPAAGTTLRRVPWGRALTRVAVLGGDGVALVAPGAVREGVNLAEEPRDDVTVEAVAATGTAPAGAGDELALRAALGRSLLLAGAAAGALAMSVRYATERIQFGRPLAKLQAIQQALALAGAEVAAASAASQAAAAAAARHGVPDAWLAIAAAKARAGEAAGEVARTAHQVHGAMGFTREHDLRLLTTRLWAWRDEDGAEAHWQDRLGDAALAAGPDGLWPLLV